MKLNQVAWLFLLLTITCIVAVFFRFPTHPRSLTLVTTAGIGTVVADSVVEHDITVANTGNSDIEVVNIRKFSGSASR